MATTVASSFIRPRGASISTISSNSTGGNIRNSDNIIDSLATIGYYGGAGSEGGIGTLNVTASMARAPISTNTTFYSGVNLAPPIASATVLSIERGAVDHRVWYTIQVNPCNFNITSPAMGVATASAKITIGSSSNSAGGGAADDIAQCTLTKLARTCIPLKPYKIYRRYDDLADFADQLREELLKLMRDSLDLTSQEQPLSASASSIHVSHQDMAASSSMEQGELFFSLSDIATKFPHPHFALLSFFFLFFLSSSSFCSRFFTLGALPKFHSGVNL